VIKDSAAGNDDTDMKRYDSLVNSRYEEKIQKYNEYSDNLGNLNFTNKVDQQIQQQNQRI
jgi:hypothetical protein